MSNFSNIKKRWWPLREKNWSCHEHGSMGQDDYVLEGTSIQVPFLKKDEAIFIANAPHDIEYLLSVIETMSDLAETGHTLCLGCDWEINPNYCHCGDNKKNHNHYAQGHQFVPMGCDCYRSR